MSVNKRVIVTGAGGFLGSHIAHYLGDAGHTIAAVGRFSATSSFNSLYPNLWKLCGMTLPDTRLVDVVKEFKPELLVHCAGTASVADSVHDPYGDFQRTVEVCAFTLETVRKYAPDCRFVLLSSASVYGNPEILPIDEAAALRPVSPYGYHKMMCETLVEEYAALHDLKTVVLRIFSAYGERLQRQVVFDICNKFNDPDVACVELFGTGRESRDFIHAQDIARAIECIHEADATGIFNIASGHQTTIAELADIISGLFGGDKTISFNGIVRSGDPLNWQASMEKMTAIGFRSSMELDQGLARYVAWFNDKNGGNDSSCLAI